VLPVTIPLERNDIAGSGGEDLIVAMKKAVEPVGQARDDFAIFCELGRRLGINFSEDLDEAGWLQRIYETTHSNALEKGVHMPAFPDFWQSGLFDLSPMACSVIMLEAFRQDPDTHPVPTPSGKIEIFSQTLASFALEDCQGHPAWFEPPEWLNPSNNRAESLHLISDQPVRRLHSQLDASPHSMAGKINGREPVDINPLDAAHRGISDGDFVEVFNNRGRLMAVARLSEALMQGVVRISTGAWFDLDRATGVERHGNPNAVTLDQPASSLSQGCSAQTCLVHVRKVRGEVPSVRAFDRPSFT
jgi:biotin/methionine sulfoxide reductase